MTVGAGVLTSALAAVTVAAGLAVSTTSGCCSFVAFSVGGGGDGVSSSWPQAARSATSKTIRNGAALTFNRYIFFTRTNHNKRAGHKGSPGQRS